MNKKEIAKKSLNVASPVASALAILNPAFLAVPVIASVSNELCGYFDSKSVEKRLSELQKKIEEQLITIEEFRDRIDKLDEHSQYVFRNNVKHLCLSALPETTETLIGCLISYIMEEARDMDEEICEIICSCNANDIILLKLIKQYISEGTRTYYHEMCKKLTEEIAQEHNEVKIKDINTKKTYVPQRWHDRNVIFGENTIFWKDFTNHFQLMNVTDMGLILNQPGKNENGEEVYNWTYLIRSMLKFQSNGVVQLEFVSSLGTISQNNINRFHITLFGQKLLEYIEIDNNSEK